MSIVESFPFWHAIQFTFSRSFQVWNPIISFSFKWCAIILWALLLSEICRIIWTFYRITWAISLCWPRATSLRTKACLYIIRVSYMLLMCKNARFTSIATYVVSSYPSFNHNASAACSWANRSCWSHLPLLPITCFVGSI